MIKYLKIKNFSIIEDISINFSSGLNVIYGESGSGKSLILTALSILLGSKSSSSLIREGSQKAILECEIETVGVIQKIIKPNSSIQSIDGENITLDILKSKIVGLVENFYQGEQEEIYTKSYQFNFINQFCLDELSEVKSSWAKYFQANKDLEDFKNNIQASKEKKEFYEFQVKEVAELSIENNEDVELSKKIDEFSQIDTEREKFSKCEKLLSQVSSNLYAVRNLLDMPQVDIDIEQVSSIVSDLESFVSNKVLKLEHLEEFTLDDLNSRMYSLQKIKKKLGVSTTNEVLDYYNKIQKDLDLIENLDTELNDLEQNLKIKYEEYRNHCFKLKNSWDKIIPMKIKEVSKNLNQMGFTYVDLQHFITSCEPGPNGIFTFEFLVSFNKGFESKQIRKIVSGGEASRLALAFKIVSNTDAIMILDEIDTGLSGETVKKLGQLLKSINTQIICVTHSEEIIKNASKKIEVYKEESSEKTRSQIRLT